MTCRDVRGVGDGRCACIPGWGLRFAPFPPPTIDLYSIACTSVQAMSNFLFASESPRGLELPAGPPKNTNFAPAVIFRKFSRFRRASGTSFSVRKQIFLNLRLSLADAPRLGVIFNVVKTKILRQNGEKFSNNLSKRDPSTPKVQLHVAHNLLQRYTCKV